MKYRPHSNSALWTPEDMEVIRFRMRRLYNFQDAAIMFNAPITGDEIDSRLFKGESFIRSAPIANYVPVE